MTVSFYENRTPSFGDKSSEHFLDIHQLILLILFENSSVRLVAVFPL